jgi:hypothetical protein
VDNYTSKVNHLKKSCHYETKSPGTILNMRSMIRRAEGSMPGATKVTNNYFALTPALSLKEKEIS